MVKLGTVFYTGDITMDEIITMAKRCEELGYDAFTPAENSGKDSFAVLAAVAPLTRTLTLGTSIVNVYSRTPTLLAMAFNGLNVWSGGRVRIGLGTGGEGFMVRGHGIPIERPLARVRETVVIMRKLLTGERISHDGEFFKITKFYLRERPLKEPMPIYLSALGPKMTQLAGEIADGVVVNFLNHRHVATIKENLAIGAKRAGRDPDEVKISTLSMTCPELGEPEAVKTTKKKVAFYCATEHYHFIAKSEGFLDKAQKVKELWDQNKHEAALREVTDEMVNTFTLGFSKDHMRDKLKGYMKAGIEPLIYPQERHGSCFQDHLSCLGLAAECAKA